jgi:ABC-type nitrate/sulfonate/bicarbonate transport system substrate-binding protein
MKEEGIDLNVVVMSSTAGLQAVLAGEMDFTGSGSSALVAVTQSNAPLKTVLAVNDQVLQWLIARPQYNSFKDLKDKKVAVTGVAAVATFMLKRVAAKYGLDGNKDLTFLALPPGQRLAALQSGVVDAGLLSSDERFSALDMGMKEILYFAELNRELATRTYDGMIGSFTTNGVVDEETQKNDLDIVREVLKVTRDVPIERAYDFSFARKADSELSQAAWKP